MLGMMGLLPFFAGILWHMLGSMGVLMRLRIWLGVLVLLLSGAGSLAQSEYFPPGTLAADPSDQEFLSTWYTQQFDALQEPSLWALSKAQREQSYRFVWLRTFHHPVAIRIDLRADGTSRLTTKMTSGAGGYKPGHLVQNDKSTLTKAQTELFLKKIEGNKFWDLEGIEKSTPGNDGAQWIIEGVKNGKYHVVTRWTPRDGPIRAIGLFMLQDLAKLKIPNDEMY
jgi:hypothetical protein